MGEINSYRVTISGGCAEIIEKKSRFIGEVFSVHSVQEAEECIEVVTKKTWDAKHHCYAFIIGADGQTMRSSDNGEPSGTAGKPILEVIKGAGLTDTLIVVTRYFGGILLGTGGLVRAYTEAAQAGLAASTTGMMVYCTALSLCFSYDLVDPVKKELDRLGLTISSQEYTEVVTYELLVPASDMDSVSASLTSRTNGRIRITPGTSAYHAI